MLQEFILVKLLFTMFSIILHADIELLYTLYTILNERLAINWGYIMYTKKMSFVISLVSIQLLCIVPQKPIVILTASYNNKDWLDRNLTSVFAQKYDNWRLIYINDASTDDTGKLVQEYFKTNNCWDKVTFIDNKKRKGHLSNQYNAIHSCDPKELVIILDGDDWFAHNNVLNYIN